MFHRSSDSTSGHPCSTYACRPPGSRFPLASCPHKIPAWDSVCWAFSRRDQSIGTVPGAGMLQCQRYHTHTHTHTHAGLFTRFTQLSAVGRASLKLGFAELLFPPSLPSLSLPCCPPPPSSSRSIPSLSGWPEA